VEVRWRSLFRSTYLDKRCTSYNAPPTSRKCAADRWSLRNFFPRSSIFMVGKTQMSHGAKSELYGGCCNGVPPIHFFWKTVFNFLFTDFWWGHCTVLWGVYYINYRPALKVSHARTHACTHAIALSFVATFLLIRLCFACILNRVLLYLHFRIHRRGSFFHLMQVFN
jgi:hypothetical protein